MFDSKTCLVCGFEEETKGVEIRLHNKDHMKNPNQNRGNILREIKL